MPNRIPALTHLLTLKMISLSVTVSLADLELFPFKNSYLGP